MYISERRRTMKIIVVIAVVLAIVYIYATLAFYYGFKNWRPV
jgi:dolichyl-phosphate-mannose--protein O-mannosyl transferase